MVPKWSGVMSLLHGDTFTVEQGFGKVRCQTCAMWVQPRVQGALRQLLHQAHVRRHQASAQQADDAVMLQPGQHLRASEDRRMGAMVCRSRRCTQPLHSIILTFEKDAGEELKSRQTWNWVNVLMSDKLLHPGAVIIYTAPGLAAVAQDQRCDAF
jgi:hypothetical protein